MDRELVSAVDLEKLTGTKASTWRYWASIGTGPSSFKLGRRRVWKKSSVLAWLAEQEEDLEAGTGVDDHTKQLTQGRSRVKANDGVA